MPLPQVVLQCDVQRLFTHTGTGDTALALGVSVHPAFEGPVTINPDNPENDLNWVLPWKWESVGPVSVCSNLGNPTQAETWDLNPKPPAGAVAAAKDALKKRVNDLWNAGKEAAFSWDKDNPGAPPPEAGHVLQLQTAAARMTTDLGYALNLCVASRTAEPKEGTVLLAAPAFTLKWNNQMITLKPEKKPKLIDGRYEWKYKADLNSAGVPEVTAYLRPVKLTTTDSEGQFIEQRTGWVRNKIAGTDRNGEHSEYKPPAACADWAPRITDLIADLWDLPRHLLDAVRDQVAMPAADFTKYWDLIVAALRDRAGLGLIDTPDGDGLLRYAIQQASPFVPRNQPDKLTPFPSDADRVRDGQLRSLQAKMRAYEKTVASKEQWATDLATVLPDLKDQLHKQVKDANGNLQWVVPTPPSRVIELEWDDATPKPGGTATVRVFPTLTDSQKKDSFQVKGKSGTTPDGRRTFAFDARGPWDQLPAVPLPLGWYEATLDGQPSRRKYVAPGVAQDLAPLTRAWSELQSSDVLARLIFPQWNQLADRPFTVNKHEATAPWFTAVWTEVKWMEKDKAYKVTSTEVGEIRPLDGRTWVVTMADIQPVEGAKFEWEFAPAHDKDCKSMTMTALLQVAVSGGDVQLTIANQEPPPPIKLSKNLDNPKELAPYRLRVELSRTPEGQMQVRAFVWTQNGWAKPVEFIDKNSPDRLGMRIVNCGPAFTAGPPALLTATGTLEKNTTVLDAWFANRDPGLALWNEVQQKVQETLPKLELAHKLALGQTARLARVWHFQLPAEDANYRKYLSYQVKDLLSKYLDQRFNETANATSVYLDFRPPTNNTALPLPSLRIQALVTKHLERSAESVALLPPAPRVEREDDLYKQQDADRVPAAKPHRLHIQVDRPAWFGDTNGRKDTDVPTGQEDTDILTDLAGFGLLVRAAGANGQFKDQPWGMLNAVAVAVRDLQSVPPESYDEMEKMEKKLGELFGNHVVPAGFGRAVAPITLGYESYARQVTVEYAGGHRVAVSPLVAIEEAVRTAKPVEPLPPFQPRQPRPPKEGHDWGLLPGLKFGQKYQLLPFVIGNCGNLPRELAPSHPAQLRKEPPGDDELHRLG